MNDFKFNRIKRNNKVTTDRVLLEHDELITNFFMLFEEYRLENLTLSDIDNPVIAEWINKEYNGLSVLLFAKALYHSFLEAGGLDLQKVIEESTKESFAEVKQEIETDFNNILINEIKTERVRLTTPATEARQKKTTEWQKTAYEEWVSGKYDSKTKCAEHVAPIVRKSSKTVRDYLKTVKD